jgi:50S ribosomal subunit-associated GTPase HflX
VIAGADVVLVGLFSPRHKDYARQVDDASVRIASLGGRVVARLIQRRGVSHGGVAAMSRPFSRKTVVSGGKAREIAAACDANGAAAVVFINPLTLHQQQALAEIFRRPTISICDADASGPQAPGAPPGC